ncbi:3-hydroxyacyl-ACP dehydratase [uncultured Planktosalinus sp.]|uniref:3-hydroxyacyl-ACP dehydratase n=1 Tax=uncultured Planktosalinus sp. TaxID=1810935 RepID=UPI0030D8A686
MLLKDFYTILSTETVSENNYSVTINLNKNHEVFKGHFPGNPVTPGVCMLQIIKEMCQSFLNCELQLKTASNVKFMALINPDINSRLRLELAISFGENDEIKVKNTTFMEDTVALKLSNTYIKV